MSHLFCSLNYHFVHWRFAEQNTVRGNERDRECDSLFLFCKLPRSARSLSSFASKSCIEIVARLSFHFFTRGKTVPANFLLSPQDRASKSSRDSSPFPGGALLSISAYDCTFFFSLQDRASKSSRDCSPFPWSALPSTPAYNCTLFFSPQD